MKSIDQDSLYLSDVLNQDKKIFNDTVLKATSGEFNILRQKILESRNINLDTENSFEKEEKKKQERKPDKKPGKFPSIARSENKSIRRNIKDSLIKSIDTDNNSGNKHLNLLLL